MVSSVRFVSSWPEIDPYVRHIVPKKKCLSLEKKKLDMFVREWTLNIGKQLLGVLRLSRLNENVKL